MRALLWHVDGALPNLALMRLSAHLKAGGHEVVFKRGGNPTRSLFDGDFDQVFASIIFEKSRPFARHILAQFPRAIIGGTGWDRTVSLEDYGVTGAALDYSLYPEYRHSIGFSQRGCRLRCGFCVVPAKEGAVRPDQTIAEIWRGHPFPRNILLLDNDFFGQPNWRERIDELQAGRFRVSFTQGINARFLTDETAAAIASVDYRKADFTTRRIYTAWDNAKDERRLFQGLELLVKYGVNPDHIMVYMLIGYWPGETHQDRERRRLKLRAFGARPYPMPFVSTPELQGYQRWVVPAYDKRVPWEEWSRARYSPRKLTQPTYPLLEVLS